MSRKRPRLPGNPDLRRQTQVPCPPIEEIEQQLYSLLSPQSFKPLRLAKGKDNKRWRERILTLPVMMAVVLSLVYRRIPSLREVLRVLALEGLLWLEALPVSVQALSKRLRSLPTELFAQVFEQVIERIQARKCVEIIPPMWQPVTASFTALWIADGSTLEELRKKLQALQGEGTLLGGKMMMVVEAFTHRPVATWYTKQATAHDLNFTQQLLNKLPRGGLLIFDLGFFKFPWFDEFTENQKFFVTRLREKTAYQLNLCLSSGTYYRDEIIQMGQYRSNPCQHPVRLVSVLWGQTWYNYLTNVLDPSVLSAEQVCELYRRRWRIEDAFLLTKRLLGLAYLWVGDTNGVQIQILATWIFYAVLNDLCTTVAITLQQPIERISVEMVFRGLYHFSRALLRGENSDVVTYLATHHKLLGLVKAVRPRHREIDALTGVIWASAP
ncbi:IS4 family transposase [Trichocoleus sp. FACHB-90]|uniref:IS4 family transposase n=1 Tax=Cyanophyceae TaxID=3028117 RepID=UPI001687E3FB|nr:IS4 family transposase [Trichocoleus sp. FACHB-90]MBD1927141.1 IS4 family transposase [Trichocoleus sp. FACHB-90]